MARFLTPMYLTKPLDRGGQARTFLVQDAFWTCPVFSRSLKYGFPSLKVSGNGSKLLVVGFLVLGVLWLGSSRQKRIRCTRKHKTLVGRRSSYAQKPSQTAK